MADVVAGVAGVGEVRIAEPGGPGHRLGRRLLAGPVGGGRIVGGVVGVAGSFGLEQRVVVRRLGAARHDEARHQGGDSQHPGADQPAASARRRALVIGGGVGVVAGAGALTGGGVVAGSVAGIIARGRRSGRRDRGHGRRGSGRSPSRARRVAGVVHAPPRMAQGEGPPVAPAHRSFRRERRSPRPPSRRDRLSPAPTGGTRHECPAQAQGTRSAFVRPLGVVTVAKL